MTDPASALATAAERLGVRFDRDAVARRFEGHSSPQSLKALVEIAPLLGIEARAFRSDLPGLAEASLPAIVHLVDTAAREGSFAVLVERSAERVVIDEEGAPSTLTAAEFAARWSGIVVTLVVRKGSAPAPELRRGGPLAQLRAWVRRGDPLTRATLVARRAGLAALVLLATASCWRFGAARAGAPGALLACLAGVLAGIGAAASVVLFFRSRRSLVPLGGSRLSSSICGRGALTDCLGVLASRYSRFAGIDWGSVGVAYFSSNLVLMAIGAVLGQRELDLLFAWLVVSYLLALPGSLSLIAVQVYPLRRFCPLCMMVHGVVVSSAALGLLHLVRGGWPAKPEALIPFATIHAAAFFGALGLVVRYLVLDVESRVGRARFGWIAATPWGALAEAAGRPRAVARMPEAPIRIGELSAPFRLDALVHPMCAGCGPVVSKLVALGKRHPGIVTIGLHVMPRDATTPADREMCAALSAVGLLAGGEEAAAAFLRVKENPWPLLRASAEGAERVVGDLLPAGRSATPEAMARARDAVAAADRLGEALERGTPTLLIHSRFWDGSVEDIEALLDRHPDLLAEVLRVPMSQS